MNRYRMNVKRKVTETMRFTIMAASDVQAHRLAEIDVRAGKHPGQSREEVVSVMECHRVLDEQQETGRQIDRQVEREDGDS